MNAQVNMNCFTLISLQANKVPAPEKSGNLVLKVSMHLLRAAFLCFLLVHERLMQKITVF